MFTRSSPDHTTSTPIERRAPAAESAAPDDVAHAHVDTVDAALEHHISAIADVRLRLSPDLVITHASVKRPDDLGVEGDLSGRPVTEVMGPLASEIEAMIQRAITLGEPQSFSFLSADHERWLSAKVAATPRGDILLAARDITSEYTLQQELEYRAHHDALTDLPNRLRFNDELTAVLSTTPVRAAILMLDLDGFKLINDVAGHAAGDDLLRAFATRLRSTVRKDDLVARMAGDEFAVLLRNISCKDDAMAAARNLQDELREPYAVQGGLSVGCGIGVTLITAADSVTDVIRRAGVALSAAKEQGPNAVASFDSKLFEAMKQRHGLARDLERAIETGNVAVVYQPIVDMDTGVTRAVEALSRWTDGEGEAISPDVFIRAAEDNGLIVPLFEHMLRVSITDATRWFAADSRLVLHINVSAVQMRQSGLAASIGAALEGADVAAANLCMEITESMFALDLPVTKRNLDELSELGVSICLDDFGTGYSSLSYLQRFAPSMLKLDRSFVSEMSKTGDPRLARAILGLARDLEIDAVAEGIETTEQYVELHEMGWGLGQGFLMSRAVTAPALACLLGNPLLPVG